MGALTTFEDAMKHAGEIGADPARLAWPPTLPIEIALKTAPLDEIREEYGYTPAEWLALKHNPVFVKDLTQAIEMVKQEGMSFKLKARLQAEELLKQSWKMIHAAADDVPPSVKADLIKSTMRWAGYDNKDTAGAAAVTNGLNIQINLGSP
jgi:hypothetical protein